MFQPVGGMDRIAHALYERGQAGGAAAQPGDRDPPRAASGVRIEHGPGGSALEADYCLCTLPVNLLARIPNDFSPAKQAAMQDIAYLPERQGRLRIAALLGGGGDLRRARLDRPGQREPALPVGRLAWRQGRAGRRLCRGLDRPGPSAQVHRAEPRGALPDLPRGGRAACIPARRALLTKPVTVAWGLTPWSEGVGPIDPLTGSRTRARPAMPSCYKPEGPIFFAGEHLSYVQFWQEGAALSRTRRCG